MGCMSTLCAQKIALKKSIKFTRFIVYLLSKSHKTCKFHRFLSLKCANFAPSFLILLLSIFFLKNTEYKVVYFK